MCNFGDLIGNAFKTAGVHPLLAIVVVTGFLFEIDK